MVSPAFALVYRSHVEMLCSLIRSGVDAAFVARYIQTVDAGHVEGSPFVGPALSGFIEKAATPGSFAEAVLNILAS